MTKEVAKLKGLQVAEFAKNFGFAGKVDAQRSNSDC